MTTDDDPPEPLLREARSALGSAYAPYSGFRVAAALEAEDGGVYTGVNVENASSPVGSCAERVALGAAVTDGARSFRRLGLVSSGRRAVEPCGMCRQALAEFGEGLVVWSAARSGGTRRWTLAELLPDAFHRPAPGEVDGSGGPEASGPGRGRRA